MLTTYLLRLAIIIIAGFSAISAVAGLGAVFKGAFWPVVIAGCGVELGRYALVAYTVQNRQVISKLWMFAVALVVIAISMFTNIGIFGFLGDSMQVTHSKVKRTEIDLSSYVIEKQRIEDRLKEINTQIAELPQDYVAGRLKLMQAFADERKELNASLKEINTKLAASQTDNIQNLDDLGPIIYTAQVFNMTMDKSITAMMLAFTLSLDMFALFLTVFVNLHTPKRLQKVEKEVIMSPTPEAQVVSGADWNFK